MMLTLVPPSRRWSSPGWKRGVWLAVLLCFSLITEYSLRIYEARLKTWVRLVAFIPLIISSGVNSGNQSAALIITALSQGHAHVRDWLRIFLREVAIRLNLGIELAMIGFVITTYLMGGQRVGLNCSSRR